MLALHSSLANGNTTCCSSFPDHSHPQARRISLRSRVSATNNSGGARTEVNSSDQFLTKRNEGLDKRMPIARANIRDLAEAPLFIVLDNFHLKHGPIFRLGFGPKSFIIVADPKVAKRLLKDNAKSYSKGILAEILEFVMGTGLIPADGEVWRARRRAIVPALHRGYVEKMIELFGNATLRLCDKLDPTEKSIEMESLFSRVTLDIIGKAVFNYEFDSLSKDTGIGEAVYTVLREAENRSLAAIPYWKIPFASIIFPKQRKVAVALRLVNKTLDELISSCKKMVDQEDDLFHEEYVNDYDPSILRFLLASGDEVSSKQLRDDLMTLLIAGHETSSAVLTWTLHLLIQNPGAMVKLQNEVDAVLEDRCPNLEDLKQLKFTRRVISESLRLYPQPPVLARRALQDDALGEYPIKRGEDVFISTWSLHRSPTLWENPQEFNPERWPLDGPDPNEVTENFKYLPFGGGIRKCVGDMFATYETVTAIAMLARRFNFALAPGAPPVGMTTGATIHTTAGLHVAVTRRSAAAGATGSIFQTKLPQLHETCQSKRMDQRLT